MSLKLREGWKSIADFINRSPSTCYKMASDKVPPDARLPVFYLGPATGRRRGTPCLDPETAIDWMRRREAAAKAK